ncbi:MAG TPA: hypothetical protein VGJ92_04290 [Methanocella sp.]|jgi:hypothetical protein
MDDVMKATRRLCHLPDLHFLADSIMTTFFRPSFNEEIAKLSWSPMIKAETFCPVIILLLADGIAI